MKFLICSFFAVSLWVLAPDVAPAEQTQRLYLSGHDKDDAVPWKFFCTAGGQSGYWTNIAVPSNWELKGFGTLSYRYDPTNAPTEQGQYQHSFIIPKTWAGRRIFLVFDGVMTDTHAQLNGQSVGPVHQGGFYRFKYEVTPLAKCGGSNVLEVMVDKHSANGSVNRAEREGDYWLYGGIYRPVYLEAVPAEFIERVAIDARADGSFAMDVFANGVTNADAVEAQIFPEGSISPALAFSERFGGEKTALHTIFPSPKTWTAETPNLYRMQIRLKHGEKVIHEVERRFGFRTMEVREGDGLYVNGRRVLLKGCDRHSFWPDSGRCLDEKIHRLDIGLMKEMNMNAVRMSHYPPDEQFLNLCDELGLYVLDELAGWQANYDTPTGRKLIEEMVVRDVNHPAILFWDNGNEGGWNRDLDGDFARWDPQQRRVLHPRANFNGIYTAHYATYKQTEAICASNTIYMPTEFLHGLFDGGAGAGMEDYWDLMRKSPIIGGGFVWAFLDEGVRHPDSGRIDVAGDQAPDGIVGPYRQKEASFFTLKELWSPIVVTNRTLPDDFDGVLAVENRYDFINTDQCSVVWQLRRFSHPGESGHGYKIIQQGKAGMPPIPPREHGRLKLNLPKNWRQADAFALRVVDPQGLELWTWVWPLPALDNFRSVLKDGPKRKSTAIEKANDIEVKTGELTVTFSKQNGFLTAVRRGSQTFPLSDGPRPADGEAALTHLEHGPEGNDYVVTASYTGGLRNVCWRIHDNGWVQCDYSYAASGPKNFMGVAFDYPETSVKEKKWLGDGPYRVWKNRLRGTTLNVWQNGYNNTISGYANWDYPEFKGCFGNVRWLELGTTEGPITAVMGPHGTFVQVLTPQFPPKNIAGKTIPALPKAGLAFLDAIPPMANKFHAASATGPQGQLTQADGTYSGTVSFFFGKLP